MRCRRARKLLSASLDDELDPSRQAALESHLAGCGTCSAELERFKEQWDALAECDREPVLPSDLRQRVLAAVDRAGRLPWHRRYRTRLLQAACVAASAVMGFAAGALLSWNPPPTRRAGPGVSAAETAMVAEAFDAPAFGINQGKEGMLRCAPE